MIPPNGEPKQSIPPGGIKPRARRRFGCRRSDRDAGPAIGAVPASLPAARPAGGGARGVQDAKGGCGMEFSLRDHLSEADPPQDRRRVGLERRNPLKIAAIDIGTNSIHMVIARATHTTGFEVLDRERDVVQIGRGSWGKGRLRPEAIQRTVEALTRY